MKTISVILTTYNSGSQLSKTINSILGQKGIDIDFKLDLVVVDDCSTDDTPALLKKLNISFHQTPRNSGGPNAGRNIGLEKAKGDYLCIADHDDLWDRDRLITLIPYLGQAPIITAGYRIIDTVKNKTLERGCSSENGTTVYATNETFLSKLTKSLNGQNTYLGAILFSRELAHIRFEEEHGMVDFDWVLRLFHGQKSLEVCSVLYTRYVDDSNLSLNENYRKKDYEWSMKTVEGYSELYPKETALSRSRINGSMGRYYYLVGDMRNARVYLKLAGLNVKNLAYYMTSFIGAKLVRRYFNIFG